MPLKKSCVNWKNSLSLLLLFAFTTACQTLPYKTGAELPKNLETHFHPCASIDGSAQLASQMTVGPALTVDWISDEECKLRAIAQNPLGQKVVEFNVDQKRLACSRPALEKLLSMDDQGFLFYDGYFSGLHSRELASFMGFYLPATWRNLPAYVSDDNKRVSFVDDRRKILIEQNLNSIATEISWSGFLGLSKRKLKLTLSTKVPRALKLELNGQELGTWIDVDRDNF